MKKLFLALLIICTGCMMTSDSVNLFSETFGDKNNPAIILNAGAGNQAISWPTEFCNKLASKGYFVIRYDYRDTGLSSAVNYEENPYDVLDLSRDALKILDQYNIEKAYFLGFSMGGQLAQITAANFPDRVLGLILIGTSTTFKPGFDGFEGIFHKDGLSAPDKDYIAFATKDPNAKTLEEKINHNTKLWMFLSRSNDKKTEAFFKAQGREVYTRTELLNPYAVHAKAMKASFELHENAPQNIQAKTLIIQGSKDPVFPSDHGRDLNEKIKGSKLVVWKGFAHAITPKFFDKIVSAVDDFIKSE